MFNVKETLKKTLEGYNKWMSYNDIGRYVFFNNHPVDIGQCKYRVFSKWLKEGKLKCFGCGRKPDYFKLVECKCHNSIHKPTGKTKHTLMLFSIGSRKQHIRFTLDHWIPKAFLRKLKRLFGDFHVADNLVPMCEYCNAEKSDSLPKKGKWGKTTHMPKISLDILN